VAVGEPGKSDILFSARLLRHLGTEATILTVLRPGHDAEEAVHADRFLSAGARSMSRLGVRAHTRVRHGDVSEQILEELSGSNHDLVVAGAPLPDLRGEVSLGWHMTRIITESKDRSVLIVRSY
jgi:nucleotide-binding universal stress UspA family protein